MEKVIDEGALAKVYDRLRARELESPSRLVDLALEPLLWHVAKRFQRAVEDEEVVECVEEALMGVIQRPEAYDAGRGKSFWGYLKMAAEADFRNLRAKRQRAAGKFLQLEVEVSEGGGNKGEEGKNDPARIVEQEEIIAEAEQLFSEEKDRVIVGLMMAGERKTGAYAEVLGILHLPVEEQREEVKRCKDRINQQLKRMGARWHDGE